MDIEILATSAVEESLSQTDVLKPYITKNDKEPSWDGNVYIHPGNEKSKKGLKRVPTQVKGKMALINNVCSWLKRYIWHFIGMDIHNLQSYLNWFIYLQRCCKRDDEKWPKTTRILLHLVLANARYTRKYCFSNHTIVVYRY